MFSFLSPRLRMQTKAAKPRRQGYRPRLEGLEERKVLSVAAGGLDAKSMYYIDNNRELWFDHLDGLNKNHWVDVAHNVAQVVAGTNSFGSAGKRETAFIRFTDGSLSECRDVNGNIAANTYRISSGGVTQISASQMNPDKVYAVFTDKTAWMHTGTNGATNWIRISTNVAKIQASQWSQGVDDCLILHTNGVVDAYAVLNSSGSLVPKTVTLAGGIKDISACPLATGGQVFMTDTSNNLLRHDGLTGDYAHGYDKFTFVASNVSKASADDAYVSGLVFVVTTDGTMTEYWGSAEKSSRVLAKNVASVEGVMPFGVNTAGTAYTVDNAYMQLTNGTIYRVNNGSTSTPNVLRIL
jgi:hypothetical protein